ncbi:MAG TPA: hypothetical protein VNV66_00935 [Pilimelia sp.]|nr:hypothetical protein [Pilimelia sp.]
MDTDHGSHEHPDSDQRPGTARPQEPGRLAIGHPAGDPTDTSTTGEPDIAGEHQDTAVDRDITSGADDDREPESPRGWAGLEPG